jgi:hypothetical protein
MRSILQGQVDLAPQVYEREAEFQPKYNQLQLQQQGIMAQGALDQAQSMFAQVADIENKYTAANRAGELQQLQDTLPKYQQAFNSLTPGYSEAIDTAGKFAQQQTQAAMGQPNLTAFEQGIGGPQMRSNLGNVDTGIVNQQIGAMPGMGEYAQYLADSSRAELSQGKSLTPEEQRMADQSARSAYAARGTALGSQAANSEILNRFDVSQQRYQQRLANAKSAAGQIQGIYAPALENAYARQVGMENYNIGAQGQAFNQALQRSAAEQQRITAAQGIQSNYANMGFGALNQLQAAQAPMINAFYKQPLLQGQVNQAQGMGMAMQQQAGPALFNPESQTGMGSIYGAYNAKMGLAGAQAQANAASSAGRMGMFGAIAGGLFGGAGAAIGCWVAREVYGEDNPAWLLFRDWMANDAPEWFQALYIKFGERFAAFISNKPMLKNIIRNWMDSKISA